MRTPVKLNKMYWPEFLTAYLPSAEDPRTLVERSPDSARFSKIISVFKFGTTFKTTQKNRYSLTCQYLSTLFSSSLPIILDIGASDGTTSLDTIKTVPFCKYYVTDLHLEVLYSKRNRAWYFFDDTRICILIVFNKWIVYRDTQGAIFPFGLIARYLFSQKPKELEITGRIQLLTPELHHKQDLENVVITKYNILSPWENEKADLIIAANLLNNFCEDDIVKSLYHIFNALNKPGRFVIIENKQQEQSTIFYMTGNQLRVEHEINGGSALKDLVFTAYQRR